MEYEKSQQKKSLEGMGAVKQISRQTHFLVSARSRFLQSDWKLSFSLLNSAEVYTLLAHTCPQRDFLRKTFKSNREK